MMSIKIDLDPELFAAIETARRLDAEPTGNPYADRIPSRVEMVRRLLGIGLAENLKRKAGASI